MTKLIHQYVTKGGAVVDSPADQHGTIERAAEVAAGLLEMDDKTVLIVASTTGGAVALRVGQIDHIAIEPYEPPDD